MGNPSLTTICVNAHTTGLDVRSLRLLRCDRGQCWKYISLAGALSGAVKLLGFWSFVDGMFAPTIHPVISPRMHL